jgi:hypothetical protein
MLYNIKKSINGMPSGGVTIVSSFIEVRYVVRKLFGVETGGITLWLRKL